jgi:curved DNA-binding protein CbpA
MKRHTCYRVLGIFPGASPGEIREAYRKKIKEFHPDVYHGDGRYALVLREAYEALSGKNSWDSRMEALAEELFPGTDNASFVFPEFSRNPQEFRGNPEKAVATEEPPEKEVFSFSSEDPFEKEKTPWRVCAFPKRLLRQEEHAFLVMALLRKAQVSIPPVQLERIASSLGVLLCSGEGKKEPSRGGYYCRYDSSLSGGTISYKGGENPVILWGNILSPHLFYQRYVIARLLGYFLYYPFRERSIMVGDFLSFFSRYDEEEINTHRFAEELLLPQSLFSVYGGKVLWYMERGKDFSYENFLKKTAQLFQVPQPVVEHRARKFERRIRLVGSMNRKGRGGSLLKEIEGLFQ